MISLIFFFFFFSSRRRHTRFSRDWSSDVCSSDLPIYGGSPLLRICGADPDVAWARAYELLGVQPDQRRPRPEPPPFEWQSSWGPRLEELRRVVPIAETRAGAGHTLTLRSLEDYADGFLIRMRFRTEAQPVLYRGIPYWPPTCTIMPELVFTAIDDKR